VDRERWKMTSDLSERDILIALRSDVAALTKMTESFIEEQKCYNREVDARIRAVEIMGTRPSRETAAKLGDIEQRVETLERFQVECKTQEATIKDIARKTSALWALIIAAASFILTLIVEIWSRMHSN